MINTQIFNFNEVEATICIGLEVVDTKVIFRIGNNALVLERVKDALSIFVSSSVSKRIIHLVVLFCCCVFHHNYEKKLEMTCIITEFNIK